MISNEQLILESFTYFLPLRLIRRGLNCKHLSSSFHRLSSPRFQGIRAFLQKVDNIPATYHRGSETNGYLLGKSDINIFSSVFFFMSATTRFVFLIRLFC